ncbi:outer membrane protein assembly factor BamD [Pseudidiomarina sp. 1APP75-32.1]|uniref:Outer membrane protein assembly factor BamD n=1 Tax=Pseudidiomarina terrestris TaxID=2820060 RepID=A0AAW7QZ84_9GAMM|nr:MULTISPECIES: outer membrane protein assembly factor BamD [unclassified Pseudidiomarina]MDN7125069.1 outer membrane protein assembly factor BamD [Pseudidiomarina sp. 1APP75-32.1]MDN7127521.1 outer membrane protein assembly factor BamD [Pseudidiomarina sp. 1APR75-33.1]MDN7129827.1 outer membrane protein assembly factor BamD [Pseudidiomarina sp. 1APR75-15]
MKLRISLLLALSVMLAACSSSPDDEALDSRVLNDADALYQRAQSNIASGNFSTAQEILQQHATRYPFGPYAHQVQMDRIYVYYKLGNIDKALAEIDRFMQLNPNHPNLDYVMYMRGLVNHRADSNTMQDLVGIDRSDRDPSKAEEAFNDFARLLQQFPDSKYAADAKQRMVAIKSRLAKYELAVARYYLKREAWLAAANRAKYVLENYANVAATEDALAIMMQSYDELGLTEMRDNARATLQANFPGSDYL